MSEILIRSARHEDSEVLAGLSGELGYPTDRAELAERLSGLLDRSDHAVAVAVDPEGGVVGWVHAFAAYRLESAPFAEIGGLVVSEAARGEGVGRRLVEAAEEWATEQGLGSMRVRSNVVRQQAHAFYRHLGYESLKEQAVFRKVLQADPQPDGNAP